MNYSSSLLFFLSAGLSKLHSQLWWNLVASECFLCVRIRFVGLFQFHFEQRGKYPSVASTFCPQDSMRHENGLVGTCGSYTFTRAAWRRFRPFGLPAGGEGEASSWLYLCLETQGGLCAWTMEPGDQWESFTCVLEGRGSQPHPGWLAAAEPRCGIHWGRVTCQPAMHRRGSVRPASRANKTQGMLWKLVCVTAGKIISMSALNKKYKKLLPRVLSEQIHNSYSL